MVPASTPLVTPVDAAVAAPPAANQDVLVAIRNAAKLGGSLVLTWAVALGIRIFLPRFLGPARFGVYNFADAFTATAFILVTLGVDTYIHKEVPNRVDYASEFFGGSMLLRVAMSGLVMAGMAVILHVTHRSPEVQRLVFVFGLAQIFSTINDSQSALLHAVGVVGGLAVTNVVGKILWGGGILLGFAGGLGLQAVALSLLASELIKSAVLFRIVRRELGLRLRFNFKIAFAALVASLPFFVNQVAHTAYSKVDVTMLSFLTTDVEVGWYGAASNLAGLALLITPLIGWVLLPLISRAARRSEDELNGVIRRSLQLILSLAVPVSLFLSLGADLWTRVAFGNDYAPGVISLRILAPMFVLTYVAMVTATSLIRLERAWSVTVVSLCGLALNPVFNLILVRPVWKALGPGGGGAGAALALISTETLVTTTLLFLLGRRAFDRQSLIALAKTAAAAAATVVADFGLHERLGTFRILADFVVYFAIVIGTGALKPEELLRLAREALWQRKQRTAA